MADRERRVSKRETKSRSRSRSKSRSRSRSPRARPGRRSRSRDRDERRPRPDIGKRLTAIANNNQQHPFRRPNLSRDHRQEPPPERNIGEQGLKVKIDREKTCPLLLRVFCKIGAHHRAEEYSRGKTPANELQIYTWKDATLKELTSLVKEVKPEARKKGTYFDFAIVFPDLRRGGFILKDIGTTCSGNKLPDDNVTLYSKKFQIGDFVDISITLPRERRDRI